LPGDIYENIYHPKTRHKTYLKINQVIMKYTILDFYLTCDYCRRQEELLKKEKLLIPVQIIDLDKDNEIADKYNVLNLPALILVDEENNEIKRWIGITQPEKINSFLIKEGYVDKKIDNDIFDDYSEEHNYQMMAKKLEQSMMSDFVIEGLAGLNYEPIAKTSEIDFIAELQKKYAHYCMQSKANLIMDVIQENPQTAIATALKQYIVKYIEDDSHRKNATMKWLYESNDINIIAQQISMLVKYSFYKSVTDIKNIPKQTQRMSLEPEQVSTAISVYTYFTLLANKNFEYTDYNRIFIEAWFNYYEDWMAREMMFQLQGNSWKDEFKGVLLDN